MNNEEKILSMLETIVADISVLKEGQAKLEEGQAKLEESQAKLEEGLDEVKQEIRDVQRELKQEINKTTAFLLDKLERRVDFKGWSAKQREKLKALS